MNVILIFVTQATLSLLTYGLIALWVIYPRLRERSSRDALTALLLFETLRAIGLVVLVPGLVDAALSAEFTIPAAIGDMLAAVLAFTALVAVRAGWRVAPALVWLFTVVGLADFINAFAQGIRYDVPPHLGTVWYLLTYLVPAFTVVHLMVIAVLLNGARRDRQRAEDVGDAGARAVTAPDRLTASIS